MKNEIIAFILFISIPCGANAAWLNIGGTFDQSRNYTPTGDWNPTGTWDWSGVNGATTWPTFNQNTTGTAANLSGTPALPDGTTATTQTAGDNSTNIATTAYVAASKAFFDPRDYGAYCDGSSHTVDQTYINNNSYLWEAGVWSGAGSYSQYDRVKGSDGAVYVAYLDGGEAQDPTTDSTNTYWWMIYEAGDEADFVAVQYLLGEGSVQLPSGTCEALDDTKPLLLYRTGVILQGTGAGQPARDDTYSYTFDPVLGTTIEGWGAANSGVLIAAPQTWLKDLRLFGDRLTTTNYYMVDFAPLTFAPDSLYNYANNAGIQGVVLDSCWNGIIMRTAVLFNSIRDTYIRENYGIGVNLSLSTANGDIDFDKLQIRNDDTSGNQNTGTIGVYVTQGEQVSFNHCKIMGVYHAVDFSGVTSHFREFILRDTSFEWIFGDVITDDGVVGTPLLDNFWMFGGDIYTHNLSTSAITSIKLSNFDGVHLKGAGFLGHNGPVLDLDVPNVKIEGCEIGPAMAYSGGSPSDLIDIELGANTTNSSLIGNTFRDDSTGYTKYYVQIDSGATNYIILGNTFGTSSHGSAESINDLATDSSRYVIANTAEMADVSDYPTLGGGSGSSDGSQYGIQTSDGSSGFTGWSDTSDGVWADSDAYGPRIIIGDRSYSGTSRRFVISRPNTGAATTLVEVTAPTTSPKYPGYEAAYYANTTSNGFAQNILYFANGTKASPTAASSGDVLGQFIIRGYTSGGFDDAARISVEATENFTAANQGSKMEFYVSDTGDSGGSTLVATFTPSTVTFAAGLTVTGLAGSHGGAAYVCVDNDGVMFTDESGC